MTRNTRRERLTVEKLAVDCLDVRELQRAGIFRDHWVTLQPSFRWPAIEQMRVARYLIQLDVRNQCVPQQIRVSWTHCNYGGARPWMHCPHCQQRIAILFKGMGGYFCRACLGNPIYESTKKKPQSACLSTSLQAAADTWRFAPGSRPHTTSTIPDETTTIPKTGN